MKVKKNSQNTRLYSKRRSDIQIFAPECDEKKEFSGNTGTAFRSTGSTGLGSMQQRVAVYARVSTSGQENEDTIESQICQLKKHIVDLGMGIEDDAIYQDNGFSGANMNRPGLENLRDKVAEGHYDIVFVLDPDRLARKFVLQMILLEEFKGNDCQLQFVKRPIGESPEEQLLLQVQGVISEYERAKIQERIRRGKLHRMKQGEIVSGRRTFGYHYLSKQEMNDIDFETKRKLVELMVKQVTIDEQNVTIEYYIPIKKYNLCHVGERPTSNIDVRCSNSLPRPTPAFLTL